MNYTETATAPTAPLKETPIVRFKMTIKLKKWGDSIGVKIPKDIVKRANLSTNSEITIEYANQKIIILRNKKPLRLKGLLSQVTKDNCHSEVFRDRIGKEVW